MLKTMKINRIKMLLILCVLGACKNNPLGEDIYKGKITDITTGEGITDARVCVAAKRRGEYGYAIVGTTQSDAEGNYAVAYKRHQGYDYRIYAYKDMYSSDEPFSYAWGDRKNTEVKLHPFGFLKVRARNVSGRDCNLDFTDLIGGSTPSINAVANKDTVVCCFELFANKDYSFLYRLRNQDTFENRYQTIHIRRFETDSLYIEY